MKLQPISPKLLGQIVSLSPDELLDLVNTVCISAQLNVQCNTTSDDKLQVATVMITNALAMFEQCGCTIEQTISHDVWTKKIVYRTGMGHTEGF